MNFHPFYHEANIVRLTILIEIWREQEKRTRNALKVDLMENWEFEFHSNFSKLKSVSWQIDDNITRKFVEIREELLIGVTDSW